VHGEPHRQRRDGEARQDPPQQRLAVRHPPGRATDARPGAQRLPRHEGARLQVAIGTIPHTPVDRTLETTLAELGLSPASASATLDARTMTIYIV
jgi:hypothetical protein